MQAVEAMDAHDNGSGRFDTQQMWMARKIRDTHVRCPFFSTLSLSKARPHEKMRIKAYIQGASAHGRGAGPAVAARCGLRYWCAAHIRTDDCASDGLYG